MRFRLPAFLLLFALLGHAALADCGDPVALKKTTPENHDAGIMVSGDTAILRPHPNLWNALLLRQVVGEKIEVCVTVIARIDEIPRSSAGGLQFWRSGQGVEDDFYAFLIDSGGNANVSRLEDGRWHDMVKWGRTKLLKKGLNARNVLQLTTDAETARLSINGKLFKTIERQPGGKGGYGTAVMAEADKGAAEFDFTDVRSSTQTASTAPDVPGDATPVRPADAVPDAGPRAEAAVPDTGKAVPDTSKAAPAAALDAEGKRIYDLLLAVPPLPANVAFAKTKFVQATGDLSPKPDLDHGLAEVTYSFDPPAGGTVNRISFFIYASDEEALKYIPSKDRPYSIIRDNPKGSISHRSYAAEPPFETQINYFFGYQTPERVAWTRWINRSGRVVMVGFTDETLPPLKAKGTTTDKISDETLDRGLYLLEIAKLQLDAIKDMKITTETTPASGAAAALDARAQGLFDYLADTPPDADALAKLGLSFVEATSSLKPKPAHGSAEIVYQMKQPEGGIETSLSFFLYPDATAAARYLDLSEGYEISVLADIPDGKMGHGTIDPFGPFDHPLTVMEGAAKEEQRGWGRVLYQQGAVVMVALVGGRIEGDGGYKLSDETLRQGALLLALGKLQLDAGEKAAGTAQTKP